MRYFCGVDTGGTFTDCVVIDENGKIYNGKSPSTPKDISVGFFNALQVVAQRIGIKLEDLLSHANILLHGTTVGTNIVLEHKGAKTGLITTSGHGDAIIMMCC